jgi:hypothetical protein
MHIFWWAIEHLDEDFQRGGYVSPKSQNRRNSAQSNCHQGCLGKLQYSASQAMF